MSQALYRKWRPSIWSDVVGQSHVVDTLRNAVAAERAGHAYLFAGPRGTGKTSVARILAKALNCLNEDMSLRPDDTCDHCLAVNNASFLDLIEIDAASNTSVEDVRELRDKINFSPNLGRYKVYIIDEVHMLSTAAFNALLKTLEEPPPHAIFILATTEVHKIPATVLSRCQRHEFRRLGSPEIIAHLEKISAAEKISIEADAIALITRQATGSLRDAISLLDQLSSMGSAVKLELAQEVLGAATSQAVIELLDAIIANDSAAGLQLIHRSLDAGSDPRQFARQLVEYLRMLLLASMQADLASDLGAEERQQLLQHAEGLPVRKLLATIRLFNQAANDSHANWQPSLPLEMAFIESLSDLDALNESTPSKPAKIAAPESAASIEHKKAANAATQSSSSATLDNQQWQQIRDSIKKSHPHMAALMNSVRVREIRGKQLMLAFASDVLKEKMEKEENLKQLQSAIKSTIGTQLEIKCFVTSNKGDHLPEGLDSSSMVATAMRLGGEIVDQNDLSKKSD